MFDDLFAGLPPPAATTPKSSSSSTTADVKPKPATSDEKVIDAGSLGEPANKKPRSDDGVGGSRTTDGHEKTDSSLKTAEVRVSIDAAVHGSKGRRQSMEDAHICLDDAACHRLCPKLPQGLRVCIYGILDGHGGSNVANFVKDELPGAILENIADSASAGGGVGVDVNVRACIARSFERVNGRVTDRANADGWTDGCCAVVLVVVGDAVYVANLGDSKAIVCRRTQGGASSGSGVATLTNADVGGGGGGSHLLHRFPWESCGGESRVSPPPPAMAMLLTQDHKPIVLQERRRIESSGGNVSNGRVNGQLEVSRSFGDVRLRRFGLSAEPDTSVRFTLTHRDEFFLLACDGLWTRYDHQNAAAFVRNRLWAGESWCQGAECAWSLGKVARGLVDDAIHNKCCQDNVSVILVQVRHADQTPWPKVCPSLISSSSTTITTPDA